MLNEVANQLLIKRFLIFIQTIEKKNRNKIKYKFFVDVLNEYKESILFSIAHRRRRRTARSRLV